MARLLIDAIKNGDVTLAQDLIRQGLYGCIDSQTCQRDGTALFFCCSRGYFDLVCLLLDCGANPDVTDKFNATPLHGAADNGHVDIVRLLIMRGANVNAQTCRGDTPLHLAAYRGYLDICRSLVDSGADLRQVNVCDLTPQREAFSRGHLEVSNYLMRLQEIQCPEKRYRASMIQLDPPSDLDISLIPTDYTSVSHTYPAQEELSRHSATTPASPTTALSDLPDNGHDETLLANQNSAIQRQSFITLDPPDDVLYFRDRQRTHESQKMYIRPEELCRTSVAVQPRMRTPDVSLGYPSFQLWSQKVPSESDNARSLKLPSGDLSDVTSDSSSSPSSYSMMSACSDVSDGCEESRHVVDDEHAVRRVSLGCDTNCSGCREASATSDGLCNLQRQLSQVRDAPSRLLISPPLTDFPDVFDSTIFRFCSVGGGGQSYRRVSEQPSLLAPYNDNVIYFKGSTRQRPASVNGVPDSVTMRPAYNKSYSLDYRSYCNVLGPDCIKPKSRLPHTNVSLNDLSSSYLTSPPLNSPSSSMTCVNIPIN